MIRFRSNKYQSTKAVFYMLFLLLTGSILLTYHHRSTPATPDSLYLPEQLLERLQEQRHVEDLPKNRLVILSELHPKEASLSQSFLGVVSIKVDSRPDGKEKEEWKMALEGVEVDKKWKKEEEEAEAAKLLPSGNSNSTKMEVKSAQIQRHSKNEKEEEEEEDNDDDSKGATEIQSRLIPDLKIIETRSDSTNQQQLIKLEVRTNGSNYNADQSSCSQDPSRLANMLTIITDPSLDLMPAFNPMITEYYATVDHEVMIIGVRAIAEHCQAEARSSNKHGSARLTNYTLGIEFNRLQWVIVDLMHSLPWLINTYTIHVYRRPSGEQREKQFDGNEAHQMCYLKQDCGLPFLSNERCGLQQSEHRDWKAYQQFVKTLVPCQSSGTASGYWLLPCRSCQSSETCFWQNAVWQPINCFHSRIDRHQLRRCLRGKNILFVGDSTNRGMMHYLMEQANGSMTEWDKTHDSKVYRNTNDNQTAVSFAYYPQFWLPINQRPLFMESISQLIKMSLPLANNRETVLVVGGVHWLAVQHLNQISVALQREGLPKIKVIVKTLGVGFHLHVDGLHHLTLDEQKRLAVHNSILAQHALSLGFQVVDTFGMTMARYKDFLQGKCACHFHRIREVLPSFKQYLSQSTSSGGDKKRMTEDMPIHYHVEGEINMVYSEILLNRICDDG